MSAGRTNQGPRGGGKGGPASKRDRRRPQEFHSRKTRSESPKELTVAEAVDRALISLKHLGGQRLSTEPGGYGLEAWVKSVNLLLDDLEAKIGKDSLPQRYFADRREIEALMGMAPDTGDIDRQILALRAREPDYGIAEPRVGANDDAKLGALRSRLDGTLAELEAEEKKATGRSGPSLLGRLLGRGASNSKDSRPRVAELRREVEEIGAEMRTLSASKEESAKAERGRKALRERARLETEARLAKLAEERDVLLSMAEPRSRLAAELAMLISESQHRPQRA